MIYYFAHPYSGNEEANYQLALKRTNKLMDLGYVVFSPVVCTHHLGKLTPREYDWWMEYCFEMLDACGGLILAPEWDKSNGVCLEYDRKHDNVIYYNDIIKEDDMNHDNFYTTGDPIQQTDADGFYTAYETPRQWENVKRGSDHYKTDGVEPFDLYKSGNMMRGFCVCNIIKYAFRNREALNKPVNPKDIEKIKHYADELGKFSEGEK